MHGTHGSALGVVGVFLMMLGAGVILDADWWWSGSALIGTGAGCIWRHCRGPGEGNGPTS